MKRLLSILILTFSFYHLAVAQEKFDWNDSIFKVGQTRNIPLALLYNGSSTLICSEDVYGINKLTFDSLVTFLNKNTEISAALIWHTGTIGSAKYNFLFSNKVAESLLKELIRLGISAKRITATGLGESRPIISEEEIKNNEDDDKKFQLDRINRRVEIIITAAPVRK
ncbi:MAG: OmpA family protein [Sporocytophaga sp.]|nr:OmpA family protein [Sporocytophaga sp.]